MCLIFQGAFNAIDRQRQHKSNLSNLQRLITDHVRSGERLTEWARSTHQVTRLIHSSDEEGHFNFVKMKEKMLSFDWWQRMHLSLSLALLVWDSACIMLFIRRKKSTSIDDFMSHWKNYTSPVISFSLFSFSCFLVRSLFSCRANTASWSRWFERVSSLFHLSSPFIFASFPLLEPRISAHVKRILICNRVSLHFMESIKHKG